MDWIAIIFLVKGLVVGFSIAAPIGPIGILTIRRTLAEGRTVGLVSGMGAATADAVYGCVASGAIRVVQYLVRQVRMVKVDTGI